MPMNARASMLWPALAGLLYALTFAPDPLPSWALPWVQLLTLTALAHWALSQSPGQAARYALVFGVATFMCGLYWLTISMHVYGELALPIAWLALLLCSLFLALYPAAAAWSTAWLAQRSQSNRPIHIIGLACVWASAWSAAELLRGTLFTGFPWLATAYGQTDGWLAGWSVIVGAPGVTWLTAWIAGALALTLAAEARQKNSGFNARRGMALVIGLLVAFVGALLKETHFSEPVGEPLTVRLVQGNVYQGLKFDPDAFEVTHEHHLDLAQHQSDQNAALVPDLILLPETIITRLSNHVPMRHWQDWIDLAASQNNTIILGAPLYGPEPQRYTNSVILIDANTDPLDLSRATELRYDKRHLVPFGEFVPRGFRWFIDMMQIPLGDFTPGDTHQEPFTIGSQRIAPNICYEDIFGEELLPAVRDGATILANFGNLGWFGDSFALRQHWQMGRMRSMETRRPMVRANNTGLTGAIDATGQVIAVIPTYMAGYVDFRIQGHTGLTPYTRWGNYPVTILVCVILAAAILRRRFVATPNNP
jgi:apolipoprotein N-acyltransferase